MPVFALQLLHLALCHGVFAVAWQARAHKSNMDCMHRVLLRGCCGGVPRRGGSGVC